jgi:molybdate transport system ATP-binding protein
MSSKVLVQLKNADVHRFGVQKPAFKDLSLSFKNTERWVIVGPVSAGKSTLAEVKHATKWIE